MRDRITGKPGFPLVTMSKSRYLEKLKTLLSGDMNFHDQPGSYASHNFHSFPAKFPPQLPRLFIEELTQEGDVVLDPMAGSGTTIVEACLMNRQAIGLDIDLLALNLTRVKVTPFDPIEITSIVNKITADAQQAVKERALEIETSLARQFDIETRQFIDKWFLKNTQVELFALISEINKVEDLQVRSFLEVAFSAIIITKSGGVSLALDLGHTRPHLARKVVDPAGNILIGSANEPVPAHASKIIRPVFGEYKKRCQLNLQGVVKQGQPHYLPQVSLGNAQSMQLGNESVDLIITSPPYASNAIDYMRAHKFSLVWFGYPIQELSLKRRDYIGGEYTTAFPYLQLPKYAKSVVEHIQRLDQRKAAALHRYYSEMTLVIREMYRVLKPGKAAIVVVGNSLMRGIDTEVPTCLAEIGRQNGFDVPMVGIRQLDRNKRMMPAGQNINLESQIQQRMHQEHVIGFFKPG